MRIARLHYVAASCFALLAQLHAEAAAIPVVDGAVAVNPDGNCSLVEAVENANAGTQTHADCAPGSAGEDTVLLAANGGYDFPASTVYVPITSAVTIDGNRATLTHSAGGFFDIADTGFLKLVRATKWGRTKEYTAIVA